MTRTTLHEGIRMMRRSLVLFFFLALSLPFAAQAADGQISCKMYFSMSGWSVFYHTASGTGVVKCSDGQTMPVALEATGGGITFGKSEIRDGVGTFTGIYDIREVLGTYVSGEAHAGATASAKAQVLTKGTVSLAMTGKGRGWNLGVSFGAFNISRR